MVSSFSIEGETAGVMTVADFVRGGCTRSASTSADIQGG
jgi:hypothetical protein